MNEQMIDLTNSSQISSNGKERGLLEGPPQKVVIKSLKKFGVNFEEIKNEINILDFVVLQPQEKDKEPIFEEYESVYYKILFVTYNLEFLVRLLTFQMDKKYQILKLDIQTKTANVKKELEYCFNSLQRRRNLKLMFRTLITFARFIESRRLICDLILKKNQNVKIEQNKDGGIIIVYSDEIRNVKLGIFWSIACSSMHEITDIVEVYYKVVELPNKVDIVNKLTMLTDPCLDFNKKYHLWKSLIDDVSEKSLLVMIDRIPDTSEGTITSKSQNRKDKAGCEETVLSSDSEGTFERSLVIIIDKMSTTSETTVMSNPESDMDKEAAGVTIVSSDSEDVPDKELTCTENLYKEVEASTIIVPTSTSEESIGEDAEEEVLISGLGEPSETGVEKINDTNETSVIISDTLEAKNKEPVESSDAKSILKETPNKEKHQSQNYTSLEVSNILNDQRSKDKECESLVTCSKDAEGLSRKSIIRKTVEEESETSSAKGKISKNEENEPVTIDLSDTENSLKRSSKQLENKSKTSTIMSSQISKDKGAPKASMDSSAIRIATERLELENAVNIENYISDSSGDEYVPEESSKTLKVEKRRSSNKNSSLLISPRRSSRISSLCNTPETVSYPNLNPRPFLRSSKKAFNSLPSYSSRHIPNATVMTSLMSPNTGVSVLISDIYNNSALLNSVLPNNFLSAISPKITVANNTPPQNVHLRLVPEVPVSSSPNFVDVNLISPPKKPKIRDDDLEITSVTYIVPD